MHSFLFSFLPFSFLLSLPFRRTQGGRTEKQSVGECRGEWEVPSVISCVCVYYLSIPRHQTGPFQKTKGRGSKKKIDTNSKNQTRKKKKNTHTHKKRPSNPPIPSPVSILPTYFPPSPERQTKKRNRRRRKKKKTEKKREEKKKNIYIYTPLLLPCQQFFAPCPLPLALTPYYPSPEEGGLRGE